MEGIYINHGIRFSLKLFKMKKRRNGSDHVCIALLLPNVEYGECEEKIDGVQQLKMKANFVEEGYMLGQFHENSNTLGLNSETLFFTLRTPVPALVVRLIVLQHLKFMTSDDYNDELKKKILKSYLSYMQKNT